MIKIINVEKVLRESKALGPVSTSQLFFGNTKNYHPQGIYSEEFFGIDGSLERTKQLSWIELNSPVIEPAIYDILKKRIFMKIDTLLSGEKQFTIDNEGFLVEDPEGEIYGMTAFMENIHRIKFKENEDVDIGDDEFMESDRNLLIKMIYNAIESDVFFINKLLVIPPAWRPLIEDPNTNEYVIDDISQQYQKIIISSNQVKNIRGSLFDVMVYRLQILIRDLYSIVKENIGRKMGLIRTSILGKRMDFSATAVIVPNPNLSVGFAGVPFRNVCQLFEPHIIYGLLNSPYSKNIPKEFHTAVKEFLNKEILMEV